MNRTTKVAATGLVLAALLTLSTAQASSGRLRLVVRAPDGTGIVGLVVRLVQDDPGSPAALVASGRTGPDGILDLAAATIPVGFYAIRLAPGTSRHHVESDLEQAANVPLLTWYVTRMYDEWLMLILYPDGRISPDYSYNLAARPVPAPAVAAQPSPLSWAAAVAKRDAVDQAAASTRVPTQGRFVQATRLTQPAISSGQPPPSATQDDPTGRWLLTSGLVIVLGWWLIKHIGTRRK